MGFWEEQKDYHDLICFQLAALQQYNTFMTLQ